METQQPIQPILISKKDAARALGVCVRTIENFIARKELPARKVGRRTLVPYRTLLEFARHDHTTRGVREGLGPVHPNAKAGQK